jgi:hypothetical protein
MPRKKNNSIFSEEEKMFLLEHAKRAHVTKETFRTHYNYYNDINSINVGNNIIKSIVFIPENPTDYQIKVQQNKKELKDKIIKALSEADMFDIFDSTIVTYKLTLETDEELIQRMERVGRYALDNEKKYFKSKIKKEKRKVIFEKIKKPKKRKSKEPMPEIPRNFLPENWQQPNERNIPIDWVLRTLLGIIQ